ncbi:probable complex I intermediate-associated protein 30 isoform X1 [Prosopis cineraria]|uniref:probable complex I intermediate-associated protein 30 isoform X1 n=1 Tax=Prosopis cineraria TaxID=364024 RepID=UPI00240F012A|nr:probable complex I intermediate-associated protein 30 isoform X1 [Prosopis cineraria]XP_054779926.1 probable complex I intermediate-associated protein 30 isoform X1 [Prosopis cineraria]XP_054779927.1 probable complex I intermediate-associated protein 30 isoform X1 [Prosopis cineraria]
MSKLRTLVQASLNATKKAFTWNVEDLMPPTERYIFNFNSKEELKKWHLYSDSEYGGLSSASLEITESENGPSGIFSGNLSLDVSQDSKWNMIRSGFCGMRSKKVFASFLQLKERREGGFSGVRAEINKSSFLDLLTVKFDGFIDLDSYDTIAMKLKGDGRCYISTIYTENWVCSPGEQEDNSWQAFVFIPKDNWYIAKIPLARYLPTWRGNVIDEEMEMNPSRILGMSLSVNAEGGVPGARSGPGDFRVELDWIKALRTQ